MNGDTSSDGNFTWSDVSGFTGGGDIVSNAAQFDDVATANSAAIASISTASDDIYVEGPFDANVSGYNSLESHFYLSANSTLTEGNIGKLRRHSYLPQYRGRQLVDIATGDVLDEDGTDDPSGTCRVEVSGTGIDMFIDGSGTATLSGTVEETQNSSHRREALGSWCYHSGHPDPVIFGSYLYGDLGGGTTYEQSAAGSLTPAGAEARETQKKAAGSITPAGAQNRTIFILRGGSLTPIGGTSKETQKPLAGSFTPTGALATVMIFLQTALGELVPTGLLSKQTQKPFSGSLTPAASIQRLTAKRFLGTVTPMGSESRETHKVLAGLLTPAGALDSLLSVFRTVTGALSPVGALSKLIEKIVGAAALVSSGTISRQTEKGPFTGALGLSGTTTKMTQRAVTGTITPSGTLIPAPIFAQSMSGVLVPSGAITTQLLGSPGAHDIAVLNQALWKMHHHIDNLG